MQEYENYNQTQTQIPTQAPVQMPVQPLTQTQSQPAPSKKPIKIVVAIVLAIVYTAVVVVSTVLIDRAILKKRIQEEIVNGITFEIDDSVDVDSGSGNTEKPVNAKSVELNKKFTVGSMFEITLLKSEWSEEIRPSNTSGVYSYYENKDSEKYFVIRAKIKNVSAQEIDFQYTSECKLKVDGKYEISGTAESEEVDGTSFYGNIKPLQEVNAIIYFSVSDEMYNTCSEYEVFLDVANNEEAAGNYSFGWEDGDFDSFCIKFKK